MVDYPLVWGIYRLYRVGGDVTRTLVNINLFRLVSHHSHSSPVNYLFINMKTKTTAIILSFFLGGFGIQKFYLGQTTAGILYFLFCWTFIPAILAWIDIIKISCMSEEKFNLEYNKK